MKKKKQYKWKNYKKLRHPKELQASLTDLSKTQMKMKNMSSIGKEMN